MAYSPKNWNTDDPITESDMDHIEQGIATLAADSGWLTTGITAATGWSVSAQKYRSIGSMLYVNVTVTRTGAAVTVDTKGNLSNSTVATLPVGYRPAQTQHVGAGTTGRAGSFGVYSTGAITLAAVGGTANIATNDALEASGTIMLG